ncbi:COG4705 family protein [Sphingomonas faeni]|uniref:COG4705 family protein n=1 Tax=Sphingomonas faeni TaxID=185950 RepID=UPI00335D174A
MTVGDREALAKVPAVTLIFWIIKVLATTLGETAGDTVSMSMNLGYLAATAIFVAILVLLVWRQIAATRYRPFLYWATIIASTTAGTTLADFATRSLGIGYAGGSLLLFACVAASLWLWHRMLGSVSVATVHEPRAELFYWITITFSQTLGTALGDWTADTGGLGYGGAAIVFGVMLAVIAALYLRTTADRVLLFWSAFILTRPLGAAVGDLLDKPIDRGGFAFSRPYASGVLVAAIVVLVLVWPLYPTGRSNASISRGT